MDIWGVFGPILHRLWSISIFLYLPAGSAATPARILAAFSAVDGTKAAKCSRRQKKAAKKVAAWCSQLAALCSRNVQPSWLHHAAALWLHAAALEAQCGQQAGG